MLIFSLSYYTFVHYKYLIVYSTDYDNPLSIANSSDTLAFVPMSYYYLTKQYSYVHHLRLFAAIRCNSIRNKNAIYD